MDKRNLEKTKIDLLNAAEKLMTGCDDPNLVTSRAIAKEAGVNAAMINYCYGSREALLFAVFNRIQQEGQVSNPAFIKILGDNLTPKEKLIEIHIESMKMMLKHFNYAKAITKYVLLNRRIDAERKSFSFIMEHFGNRKTEGECRRIAFELSGIHELTILRHEELKETCGIDLKNEEVLRKYVTEHINMFLGE